VVKEGSSATDSVTDLKDVTEVSQKEDARCKDALYTKILKQVK
jgi:hypothetical protein